MRVHLDMTSEERKVLPNLLIRTLAFFLGKSDDSQMRKTKIFHLLGPCQQEGPA